MLTSKLILKKTKCFAIRSDNTEIASIKQMLTATICCAYIEHFWACLDITYILRQDG